MKNMIDDLIHLSKKPKLYEKSTKRFWDDNHISEQMLKAHLAPDWDAASRNHKFIDESVNWIVNNLNLNKNSKILDLGCGPGLYCSRFAQQGHNVTGIDFSKRSIEYAKNNALQNGLNINYIYDNYLNIDYENEFDLISLIYCDFGVLSNEEVDILLSKVYKGLKPGGVFLFDVFTHNRRSIKDLEQNWGAYKKGFWSNKSYMCLSKSFYYKENETYLDQTIIITEEKEIDIYRIWDHVYNIKTMNKLLDKFNFSKVNFFSDVAGKEYNNDSKTLTITLQK